MRRRSWRRRIRTSKTEPHELIRERLLEEVTITTRALAAYMKLTPGVAWRDTPERLRAELRKGQVYRKGKDYLRIHVPGRFVVRIQRGRDGGMVVWDLQPLGERKRRAA